MTEDMTIIAEEAYLAAKEILEKARLEQGELFVVGCSTSEVGGATIGTYSSPELAEFVQTFQNSGGKHLVFLIGGSYGLHPSIKAEAKLRLSMSPMTFPHHLARVMVLEQIYRTFKINEGSSYHK